MSEQPKNLQDAPECPTDDEVLAKRDAEIERLRAALTKADALLGDTLDSDFGMWSRNDVSNIRRPVWAAYQLVHDALAHAVPEMAGRNGSRSGDGQSDKTITRKQAEAKWSELREAASVFFEYEDGASADFIDAHENSMLDAVLDTLFD